MNQNNAIQRTTGDLANDQSILQALITLAADVELFTIPLYMTSLYSIAGVQAQTNGTVVPYIGPNESYSLQGKSSQKAYNIIYSVYIQEMLHLQLALNIGNVLGVKAALTQPKFPPKPEDPNWIPCLGKLGNLNPAKYPEFENITAALGELDENTINLFLAIELPDDESLVAPPSVPLICSPSDVPSLTFGGIGNLYHIIEQYMGFEYPGDDGKSYTLFEYCYTQAMANSDNKIVQVNLFEGKAAYSHMTLDIAQGTSVSDAYTGVLDMIAAIVSEGEGSSKTGHNFVSPNYRPDDGDIATNVLWDTYSHWARFEEVKALYKDVLTWPKWRAERELSHPGQGPWLWTDLLADPLAPSTEANALDTEALAKQKADAWNSPDIGPQLNDILNSTFELFLNSINRSWSAKAISFPANAMYSISSRVTSVWAAGAVPQFAKPSGSSTGTSLHACQGLNTKKEGNSNPGECQCATAIAHTCAGTNSCESQGGCGYAIDNTGTPNYYAIKGSTENYIPSENTKKGNGGCGAPIPTTQVFTQQYGPDQYGPLNGENVWDHARSLFFKNNPHAHQKTLTPSPVRIVLPPS